MVLSESLMPCCDECSNTHQSKVEEMHPLNGSGEKLDVRGGSFHMPGALRRYTPRLDRSGSHAYELRMMPSVSHLGSRMSYARPSMRAFGKMPMAFKTVGMMSTSRIADLSVTCLIPGI